MATKEKWIDLFEKAVGRPPHALEIEEGQKADFDLKAIKGIAAMGLDQDATPSEPTEEVDEYDVAEEVFEDVPLGDEEETTPLERSLHQYLKQIKVKLKKIQRPLLKKHKLSG